MLQLKDVSVSFQHQVVLSSLNLELSKGHIGVVLGKSGVGKTTMLKLIAGLCNADSGSLFWKGDIIKGPANTLVPGHKDITLVAQNFNLMPMLTAKENIIQGMPGRAESTQQKKAVELIKAFKLQDHANKKVQELSGGQQQRVAIAKTLASNVSLFLFDEIFSQLDLATKMEIMIDLKVFLRQKKKTALFVLHNALDTFYLADKLFILQDGNLVQSGDPAFVLANPANLEVGRLFGYVNTVTTYIAKKYLPQVKTRLEGKIAWFRPSVIRLSEVEGEYQMVDDFRTEQFHVYIIKVSNATIWVEEPISLNASQ